MQNFLGCKLHQQIYNSFGSGGWGAGAGGESQLKVGSEDKIRNIKLRKKMHLRIEEIRHILFDW